MDSIETAIRSALEKGNAEDRAFREKVYRSAFAALERSTQANRGLTVEQAINRRKTLQARIAEIETEFLPAAPRAAPEDGAAPVVDAPDGLAQDGPGMQPPPVVAPALAADEPPGIDQPFGGYPAAAPAEVLADRDERRAGRRRRHPFVTTFYAVTVLAVIAVGGWFGWQTGLFKSAAERDTSVPNPPVTVEDEDFTPDEPDVGGQGAAQAPGSLGETAPERNWVTLFSPADIAAVSAPQGASAEPGRDESGAFVKLGSSTSGAAVVFTIPQAALDQLAGRKALFDIVARASDGGETEIAVDCDFGELGDCGRRRYVVGYERAEYLFELDFPQGSAGAAGSIAITSDFSGGGKTVDIYEIRVSASE